MRPEVATGSGRGRPSSDALDVLPPLRIEFLSINPIIDWIIDGKTKHGDGKRPKRFHQLFRGRR